MHKRQHTGTGGGADEESGGARGAASEPRGTSGCLSRDTALLLVLLIGMAAVAAVAWRALMPPPPAGSGVPVEGEPGASHNAGAGAPGIVAPARPGSAMGGEEWDDGKRR
ncbi:hypothetical protein Pelo_19567 [Pelomyxa schiedti]|nr:hypothetical protein Pelo_19567 [Pelomyxa schiedti]